MGLQGEQIWFALRYNLMCSQDVKVPVIGSVTGKYPTAQPWAPILEKVRHFQPVEEEIIEDDMWRSLPAMAYIIGCMPSFFPALLIRDLWMCGITPPPAMVALMRVSSSSSPLIASCK
jgi:hypothetical protein